MNKSILLQLLLTGLFVSTAAGISVAKTETTEVFATQTDHGSSTSVAKQIRNTATRKVYHFLSEENFLKPTELYAGGYDAVQIIRHAEKRYYREHGAYTANIADLDLTFHDSDKQLFVNGTSRIYLNSGFYYVLTNQLVAVYFSEPPSNSMGYHLDFYFNGKQQCIAACEQAKITCEKLGGTNPTVNPRMRYWTVYDLPEDFL